MSAFSLYSDSPCLVSQIFRNLATPALHTCIMLHCQCRQNPRFCAHCITME